MVAVVMMHTCSTFVDHDDLFNFTTGEALYLNTLHRLCVWAVPVFFMITGALLLRSEKKITYELSLKKYALRIALCLLLFGSVMGAMKVVGSGSAHGSKILVGALYSVISGDSFDHLWYLYALIGIYLILPILKAFVDSDKSGKGLAVALVLLLIFDFICPLVEGLTGGDVAFYIPITYPVFYVLLGHYMVSHRKISIKVDFAVLLLLCVAFVVAEQYGFGEKLAGYHSPFTAILAAAMFDLFRHIEPPSEGKAKKLWSIDRLCFGVYLIHPVFIHLSYRYLGLTPVSAGGMYPLATFGLWAVFCLLSFGATWVMTRVPYLKKLLV